MIAIADCPQLEPTVAAAYREVARASPPDGELAIVGNPQGEVAVATEQPWPAGRALAGRAGIVTDPPGWIDLDGAQVGPWDFAQASDAGNAAIARSAVAALGVPPSPDAALLELHAGAGNLTRGYRAVGLAGDRQRHRPARRARRRRRARLAGDASAGPFAAVALDPPRTGAADAIPGIIRHAPGVVVYVACDVSTLARDAARLVDGGYRATDAWPIDAMPQTAHVEVVLRLERTFDADAPLRARRNANRR